MSSGIKQLIINTQERAVSGDVNRLQSMATRGWAEMLRYLTNVSSNDDLDAGSVAVQHTTLENPLRADILNGLMVQPQIGSLNILVEPGMIQAIAPDGDSNSSVLKVVIDDGIVTLGALAQTVGGASLRVDVIEVQVGPSATTETALRDVFNVGTNSFAPTTLPKVTSSNVTGTGNIRIRHGVAGGAFPGTVSGWVPLAVVSVPAGATTCDQMTFWDVRPLMNDRPFGPFALEVRKPLLWETIINGYDMTSLTGKVDVVLGSRRLGGELRTGAPGNDSSAFIDMTAARNQEAGFSLASGNPWALYMCTPFGLPRWARYRDAVFGIRVPRSPRGIPLVSRTRADMHGNPITDLSLPAAMGLGTGAIVTTENAVCVSAGRVLTSTLNPVIQNSYTHLGGIGTGFAPPIYSVPFSSGVADIVLVPGQDYPGNARELYVRWGIDASQAGILRPTVQTVITEQTYQSYSYIGAEITKPTSGVAYSAYMVSWLPVPSTYPSPGLPSTQTFRITADLAGGDSPVGNFQILGWRLG